MSYKNDCHDHAPEKAGTRACVLPAKPAGHGTQTAPCCCCPERHAIARTGAGGGGGAGGGRTGGGAGGGRTAGGAGPEAAEQSAAAIACWSFCGATVLQNNGPGWCQHALLLEVRKVQRKGSEARGEDRDEERGEKI